MRKMDHKPIIMIEVCIKGASVKYNNLLIMSSRMMPIVPLLESSLLYNNRKEMLHKEKKEKILLSLHNLFISSILTLFLTWREFFPSAIVAKKG